MSFGIGLVELIVVGALSLGMVLVVVAVVVVAWNSLRPKDGGVNPNQAPCPSCGKLVALSKPACPDCGAALGTTAKPPA